MIDSLANFSLWGIFNWESVAVICALAYVWFAARENILCWYFALVSTAIYTLLFWNVSLLMESALNVYYLVMAVYGWWLWRDRAQDQKTPTNERRRKIHRWPLRNHLLALSGVVTISLFSGWLLNRYTGASLPYIDSFTTWAAIFTTWMVARKVLENWIYWIVIDAISIYLYLDKELYQTAGLYVLYIGFAIYGWYSWSEKLKSSEPSVQQTDSEQAV